MHAPRTPQGVRVFVTFFTPDEFVSLVIMPPPQLTKKTLSRELRKHAQNV